MCLFQVTLVETQGLQEKTSHQKFKESIGKSETKIAMIEKALEDLQGKLAKLTNQYAPN